VLRKPVTIQYSDEERTPYPRFRARIAQTRDPVGGERCVASYLCSASCTVDCISMQSAMLIPCAAIVLLGVYPQPLLDLLTKILP
jgi:formate hydrogenlyase subunit 6/NADH:ubiquinone oxidoreductase subunit I